VEQNLENILDFYIQQQKNQEAYSDWDPNKKWKRSESVSIPRGAKYLGTMPNGVKVYRLPNGQYFYQ
jgi:hypothetical protein